MRSTAFIQISVITTILLSSLLAEPTESREWKSTAGTTIQAVATKIEGNNVILKSSNGREVSVPLNQFIENDQEFLKKHFSIDEQASSVTSSNADAIDSDLPHPVGEISGPVSADDDSNYFVYIPDSLKQGRKAPLLFVTDAGGGNKNTVKKYSEGGKLAGWIIAASVESKNGDGHPVRNHEHTEDCVEHLLKNLPIDDERVYFAGMSGGGAMSFYNSTRIKSAGNIPVIGYAPGGEIERGNHCYAIGGTRDFNRYPTAHAVEKHGKRGFHRFHVGGHSEGPAWLKTEAIVWLNGHYLAENKNKGEYDKERLDYEASVIGWIGELKKTEPHRAHYWSYFLKEEYEIQGQNASAVDQHLTELNKDPNNARYSEGLIAISDFSKDYFAEHGTGSKKGFMTSKIKKASERLAEEYKGVPEIEKIARDLGSK